ncbi:MAG: alpha/beta fold hydrolase [Burkholderiaceae bacterium]|nr:alpha/beta fold hydrolase [Burkholderiaceae bacterium]
MSTDEHAPQQPIRDGQYAQVGDAARPLRIHYASCGDERAPLLLMLHGFPEGWFAWRERMPAFAARFHVVAPDLRGYGRSDKPEGVDAYRVAELVSDVNALIDALGHERCALIGHDWGGVLAWAFAIAHPERVERLVILNAPHPVPFAEALAHDRQQQAASAYMNWLRRAGSETVLARDNFARLDAMLESMGGAPWLDAARRAEYHEAWGTPGALAAAVNYYRASPLHPPGDGDAPAAMPALDASRFVVRVPTLVIWGERDLALLPSLLDGLDRLVPQLRIVRLAEATHWVVHEAPQRIAAEIAAFVDDLADGIVVRVGAGERLVADARPLREAVFIEEQGVPAAIEHDGRDAEALHCVAYRRGRAIATGRLLPEAKIGRMAVRADARGQGIGTRVLDALVARARARGDAVVELSAQCAVEEFYRRSGFETVGEPYPEAGIAHVRMRRTLG